MLMNQTQGRRKGISTVIAGTIIILLIIVGVIPLLMLYLSTAQTMMSTYNVRVSYQEQKELERAEANVSNNILTIANVGSIPIDVSYLILSNSKGICSAILNVYKYISTTVPNPVIEEVNTTEIDTQEIVRINPGGYIKLNISSLAQEGIGNICSIVTARGNVIKVMQISSAGIAEAARAVVVTPVSLDVSTIVNRTDVTVNESQVQPAVPPNNNGTGMSRIRKDGYGITALVRYIDIRSLTNEPKIRITGVGYWERHYYHIIFPPQVITRFEFTQTGWIPYSNIYIGYNPEWSKSKIGSPRYNILITGFLPIKFKVINSSIAVSYYNNTNVDYLKYENGGYVFNLYKYLGEDNYGTELELVPYRIKIINYVPSSGHLRLKYDLNHDGNIDNNEILVDEEALGYWWVYSGNFQSSDLNLSCGMGSFELDGNASEIIIYMDALDIGYSNIHEASYDPYLFTADVDGNGYPEFLFITEDEGCSLRGLQGFVSPYNDIDHESNSEWADDWSISKFLINLTGYSVCGKDISFVQVAIRVFFHDNIFDTPTIAGFISQSEEIYYRDRPIFGVYLVNAESGKIVSSREWCYDELDELENTFPPKRSFIVLTASLVVPENATCYLAIGFQDPYSNDKIDYLTPWPCASTLLGVEGCDDADFIIALEVVGLTLYARP